MTFCGMCCAICFVACVVSLLNLQEVLHVCQAFMLHLQILHFAFWISEKTSLLSRLFRRSGRKQRGSSAPPAALATFSAQFPPAEWFNQRVVHLHSVATQTINSVASQQCVSMNKLIADWSNNNNAQLILLYLQPVVQCFIFVWSTCIILHIWGLSHNSWKLHPFKTCSNSVHSATEQEFNLFDENLPHKSHKSPNTSCFYAENINLTLWRRFLMENPVFTQLVKKFPTFYGI
jgi:hypothetical protein